jgi:hypothetical protein
MNVIPLDRARSRLRPQRRVEPPSALGTFGGHVRSAHAPPATDPEAERDEDRLRMRQNLAAFVVIAAIVVLGTWLISNLQYYSRLQTCIEAGHRNCLPIETKYQPSPYWR